MADKPSFLDAFEAAGNTLLQAVRDAFGYVRSTITRGVVFALTRVRSGRIRPGSDGARSR